MNKSVWSLKVICPIGQRLSRCCCLYSILLVQQSVYFPFFQTFLMIDSIHTTGLLLLCCNIMTNH